MRDGSCAKFATGEVDPTSLAVARSAVSTTSRGDSPDPRDLRAAAALLCRRSRRARHAAATVFYYLATAPEFFAAIVQHLGAAGLDQEEDGQWRRVIIEKPFGRDLDSARAAQSRNLAPGPRRASDLPHRPLPGQGDRPEHPGLPLRQRHLRADLEPALHRPRADHRGGDRRRRSARRLLRHGRRAARHGAQPHLPADRP